jgi:serine/threonine protein kinase
MIPPSRVLLTERIHRGVCNEVWAASWAGGGGAPLVVKRALDGADPRAAAALGREREVLSTFGHPGAVRLIDVIEGAGRGSRRSPRPAGGLVLERADAGSLADVVVRSGGLGPEAVTTVIVAAASSLGALHDAGFVHGDVSPANLLYDRARGVLLADFATVAPIGAALAGSAGATPGFAAPEMAPGLHAAPSADVFALGASALWMLAGLRPRVPGETVRAGPLTGVLLRAVQRDPQRRHQSMGQLLADVDATGLVAAEQALRRHVGTPSSNAGGGRPGGAPRLLTKQFGPVPPQLRSVARRRRARALRRHAA